jgi:GH24 family phage-related lysozyme (muramidase)
MSGLKNIFFGGDSSSPVDQSKVKLQEKTKDTANKLSNVLADNVVYDNFTASTPNSVVLNGIYKLMMKNSFDDQLERKEEQNQYEAKQKLIETRHKEIIDALSFSGKFKKEKPKKQVVTKKPTVKEKKEKKSITDKIDKIKTQPTKKTTTKIEPQIPTAQVPTPTTPAIPPLGKVAAGVAIAGVSAGALAKIKGREGFRSSAYFDPKRDESGKVLEKHYSIGYGHQITQEEIERGYIKAGDKKIPVMGDGGKDTVISKEDAETLVKQDFEKFEKYAEKTPNFEKLNQDAQEALIDMTYNMGVGWMWPTLRKQFEEMDLQGAAKTIRNSRYATQVKDRAQKNADAISNGLKNLPPTNIPSNTIGSNIDTSSKENKQLNESLQNTSTGTNTINQTNVNVSQSPQQTSQRQSVDDRSAYERKSRIK